jgi:hypothetical protein
MSRHNQLSHTTRARTASSRPIHRYYPAYCPTDCESARKFPDPKSGGVLKPEFIGLLPGFFGRVRLHAGGRGSGKGGSEGRAREDVNSVGSVIRRRNRLAEFSSAGFLS